MNLRHKLLIILSLLLVIGFGSTSIISYLVSRHSLRSQILSHELPLTCDNIYSEIQRDLLAPVFISSLMSNDAFLRNWVIDGEKNPAELVQYLNEIKVKYHAFTSFFVSEKTRRYYHAGGILKAVKPDAPRDIWYFRVRSMKEDYESNVDPDMAHGDAMTVFINHRVFDFAGNYIGATGIGLRISMVNQLIESYHRKYQRSIYFSDLKGNIVLRSQADNNLPSRLQDIAGMQALLPEIFAARQTVLEYSRNGQHIYLNTRFIPELNWILLAEQSDGHALASIFKTLILNLTVCGLISILIIIITCMAINHYQNKIETMLKNELKLQGVTRDQKLLLERQHHELQEQNTKLTQLNASKNKLFSIIAHDLRNPIGSQMQLLYLLEDAVSANDRRRIDDILGKLKKVSETSFKLLENLSEWACSQMAERTCEFEHFPLAPLIRECVDFSHPAADPKQIAIMVNCPENLNVYADANMIRTILRNLLSNAVKFTPARGTVSVRAAATTDHLAIAVQDSGVGIAPDRIATIFNSVGTESTFGTDGEKGTGLGLSLCYDLAARNNGKMEVTSQTEHGSTFTLLLPLSTDTDTDQA